MDVIDNSEELEDKPPDTQQLGEVDASQNVVSTEFVPESSLYNGLITVDKCSFDSLVDSSFGLCQTLSTQEDESQDIPLLPSQSENTDNTKDHQEETSSKLQDSSLDHNVVIPINIMKLLQTNDKKKKKW